MTPRGLAGWTPYCGDQTGTSRRAGIGIRVEEKCVKRNMELSYVGLASISSMYVCVTRGVVGMCRGKYTGHIELACLHELIHVSEKVLDLNVGECVCV